MFKKNVPGVYDGNDKNKRYNDKIKRHY